MTEAGEGEGSHGPATARSFLPGWRLVGWVLLLALSFGIVRTLTNSYRSYWVDEFDSLIFAEVVAQDPGAPVEQAHRLFYHVIAPFARFSQAEWCVRMPNTIAMCLGILAMGWVGWLHGGRRSAIRLAVLTALAPSLILRGGEVRYYSFLFTVSAASLVLLEACRSRRTPWALPALALLQVVAVGIQPSCLPWVGLTLMAGVLYLFGDIRASLARVPRPWWRLAWFLVLMAILVAGSWMAYRLGKPYFTRFGGWSGLLQAKHAPNLKASPLGFLDVAWRWYFFWPHSRVVEVMSKSFLVLLAVAGVARLWRSSRTWAVGIPAALVLGYSAYFFVPSTISFVPKYAISGLPALLLLIDAGLEGLAERASARFPGRHATVGAVLVLLFLAGAVPTSWNAMFSDVSHYRWILAEGRGQAGGDAGGKRTCIVAPPPLVGVVRWYAQNLPVEERPRLVNAGVFGLPGLLAAIASHERVLWFHTAENRGGVPTNHPLFQNCMQPAATRESRIFSGLYTVEEWKPAFDVVVLPAERFDVPEAGGDVRVFFPGGGCWKPGPGERPPLLITAEGVHPMAEGMRMPSDRPVVLRSPGGTVHLFPDWLNGAISTPGGLPTRATLRKGRNAKELPVLKPEFASGLPIMTFSGTVPASYALDVPSESCHLRVVYVPTGAGPALFRVDVDGSLLGIVGELSHAAPGVPIACQIPLPRPCRSRRVDLALTFLVSAFPTATASSIRSVDIVRGDLAPGQSGDWSPRLGLAETPPWCGRNYPPDNQPHFWLHKDPTAPPFRIEADPSSPSGRKLVFPIRYQTETFQLGHPVIPLHGGAALVSFEARRTGAPQHSLELYAAVIDKQGRPSAGGFRISAEVQGTSEGEWHRYSSLVPIPPDRMGLLLYYIVYRHPGDQFPPPRATPPNSSFEVRDLRITSGPEIR